MGGICVTFGGRGEVCKETITKPGLSPGFVMHKGIPIAIVRLRHKKTLRQYVLVVLEY